MPKVKRRMKAVMGIGKDGVDIRLVSMMGTALGTAVFSRVRERFSVAGGFRAMTKHPEQMLTVDCKLR